MGLGSLFTFSCLGQGFNCKPSLLISLPALFKSCPAACLLTSFKARYIRDYLLPQPTHPWSAPMALPPDAASDAGFSQPSFREWCNWAMHFPVIRKKVSTQIRDLPIYRQSPDRTIDLELSGAQQTLICTASLRSQFCYYSPQGNTKSLCWSSLSKRR